MILNEKLSILKSLGTIHLIFETPGGNTGFLQKRGIYVLQPAQRKQIHFATITIEKLIKS